MHSQIKDLKMTTFHGESNVNKTGLIADDLVFGANSSIVILDGKHHFREVEIDNPNLKVYMCGHLINADILEILQSDRLCNAFGKFIVLIHDIQKDTLTIQNDRYGMIPFYQSTANDSLFYSTRIKTLVKRGVVMNRLNYSALSDLLAFDVPFGTKTLVTGIHSIESGISIQISLSNRKVKQNRRWEPAKALMQEKLPFKELCNEMFHTFVEGFENCTAGSELIGITLSGGIDSRCFLAVGRSLDVPMAAYNYSVPGSRSWNYSQRMADISHIPYHSHPVGSDFAKDYTARIQGVISLTEGMTFSSEVECHWLREQVSGVNAMLHGTFAELSKLSSMHFYYLDPHLLGKRRTSIPDVIWRRFAPSFERKIQVFSEDVREHLSQQAKRNLQEKIESLDESLTVSEIMQILYIEEFISKVVKYSLYIWDDRLPTHFPFGYPKYIDLLLRVQPKDKMKQYFQMDLLKRTARELYEFPDANTGARVNAPELWNIVLRLADKVRRVLNVSKIALDHSDQLTWFALTKPSPEEILLKDNLDKMFDRHQLSKLLEQYCGINGRHPGIPLKGNIERKRGAVTLEKILLFQLWREYIEA